MCKGIRPLAIVAVLVSAASSTLSIPVLSEGSEIVIRDGEGSSPAEGEGHRMLRGKDEANQEAHEERVGPPTQRELFESVSLKAFHMFDVPAAEAEIRRRLWIIYFLQYLPVASSYADILEVSLHDVAKSLVILREAPGASTINNDKLALMAVGHQYFRAVAERDRLSPRTYTTPSGHSELRKLMDKNLFEEWKKLLSDSDYGVTVVFEKMRRLREACGDDSKDINDLVKYAYMAMGSELLSKGWSEKRGILPLPTSALEVPATSTQRAVDRLKTKNFLKRLRDDSPTHGETDEQPLTEAAKKAMGKDLTLGRGE
ncbi:hypothetical protein PsorP6_019634 [Peronosclerospora sorghi]|nr:hypothetical protein PsorP6_019634 [Peronosclerospora sorghi]